MCHLVHFSLRNPKNLAEEVPQGKRGVLAIFDPTSLSYPGFIQTEDLVYLKKENTCECGRNGQKVVYLSRVAGAEIGCCAINLEKHMDAAEEKKSNDRSIREVSTCTILSSLIISANLAFRRCD